MNAFYWKLFDGELSAEFPRRGANISS